MPSTYFNVCVDRDMEATGNFIITFSEVIISELISQSNKTKCIKSNIQIHTTMYLHCTKFWDITESNVTKFDIFPNLRKVAVRVIFQNQWQSTLDTCFDHL